MRAEQLAESTRGSCQASCPAVRRPNLEDQPPLQEELSIRRDQRAVGIVDVGALGRRAVQLDDRQVATRHERIPVRVADIESPDEKAVDAPGDRVDPLLELRSDQVPAIGEHRALGVVAREPERHALSRAGDPAAPGAEPRKERP